MVSTRLIEPIKTVIIGSGNVASCIAPALECAGVIEVTAVFSPTLDHAATLAKKLQGAIAVSNPAEVPTDALLYLVAVKDDAIAKLATTLPPVPGALWLHTSGGVEASTLRPLSERFGVFYPLQTFSKGVDVDLEKVPIFIEASNESDIELVKALALAISPKVQFADGITRSKLHAAAVFACNFTNHLWAIADNILHREANTDLSVLYPLLQETLRKAMTVPPAEAQTGPAVRADRGVIAKHCSLLTNEEAELYNILSERIISFYNK